MYQRHNVWDEDKWNIHTSGSGYSGSSKSEGVGYTGNGKNPFEHYHKSEMYGSNSSLPEKIKDSYRSNENQEDVKKAEDEKKDNTIVDAVEHEDKLSSHSETEEDSKPKKETKSIEDAIKEAIKEEKQIVI